MVRLLPLARLPLAVVALAALLPACNNPCQAMCAEISAYARECGFDPPSDDMEVCLDKYAGPNLVEGDAEACIEAADPQQLREWWTCEELGEQYQSAAN